MLCLPPQHSMEWSSAPWASIWEVQEDVLSFSSCWPWHFESLAQLEPHRLKNLFTPQDRSVRSLAPGRFKSCIFIIFRLKATLFRIANMTIWLRKQLDSPQLRSGPRPRSLHGPDCQLPLSILLSWLGSTRQNEHQPFTGWVSHSLCACWRNSFALSTFLVWKTSAGPLDFLCGSETTCVQDQMNHCRLDWKEKTRRLRCHSSCLSQCPSKQHRSCSCLCPYPSFHILDESGHCKHSRPLNRGEKLKDHSSAVPL